MKYIVNFPDELVKSFAKATLTVDVIINDGKVVSVGGVGVEECKTGKWLDDGMHYICSHCGFRGWKGDHYCSECGAKMEGVDE